VTVIVAPALLEGLRCPHEVQKLAASSTSLPHDVQSAIQAPYLDDIAFALS
jgi:hypothetical protein